MPTVTYVSTAVSMCKGEFMYVFSSVLNEPVYRVIPVEDFRIMFEVVRGKPDDLKVKRAKDLLEVTGRSFVPSPLLDKLQVGIPNDISILFNAGYHAVTAVKGVNSVLLFQELSALAAKLELSLPLCSTFTTPDAFARYLICEFIPRGFIETYSDIRIGFYLANGELKYTNPHILPSVLKFCLSRESIALLHTAATKEDGKYFEVVFWDCLFRDIPPAVPVDVEGREFSSVLLKKIMETFR